ncbi:MAG TPA: hypothetical protein VFP89_12485, partial [Propionibacteriaceae bacterium]|nr:hypothetical protein [Propionibacteriaceae bacterium]
MDVTILGPQRRPNGARTAVGQLMPHGPVATVNAGWQERESDTRELEDVLGGRMVNLELYRRWRQISEADPAYAAAERELSRALEDLRSGYLVRLRHALAAAREAAA